MKTKTKKLKFTTVLGLIRYCRAEERRMTKLADIYPEKTKSDKWMKVWLDATANAMGWTADTLRDLQKTNAK